MPGTGSLRNTSSGKSNVDTRTLPRIGGLHGDAEIQKFRMNDWFRREGVVTIENKFSYIITAELIEFLPQINVLPLSKRSIGEKIKKQIS